MAMGGVDVKQIAGLVAMGAQAAGPALDVVRQAAGPVAKVAEAVAPPELKDVVKISKEAVEIGSEVGKGVAQHVGQWASMIA